MSAPVISPTAPTTEVERTVLTLFGTRPEIIKVAPVIHQLSTTAGVRSVVVASGQHRELVAPLIRLFEVCIDHDLKAMRAGQSPNQLAARIQSGLDTVLAKEKPDVVLVQGDTTTALMGAMAAFYRKIPVGHIEAGLRTDNPLSPYPEEMNRRLITKMATYHFAATAGNRKALLDEGVAEDAITITGNPVVDALQKILQEEQIPAELKKVLRETEGTRRIVLTTHRRESFDGVLQQNLKELRAFVDRYPDLSLIFPVHLNPVVQEAAKAHLMDHPRIHLIEPMSYCDFIGLLAKAWLIVSDSGGIQEEAPSLGVPLLILRNNTERPESVECGCAHLIGDDPAHLRKHLHAMEARSHDSQRHVFQNPFGNGDSRQRIVQALLHGMNDKA